MTKNSEIKGKVVLITGASRGIGKEATLAFVRAGANTVPVARNVEKLRSDLTGLDNALVLQADITDEKQTEEMVAMTVSKFKRLDVLINNAAVVIMSRGDSLSPEILRKSFETNVIGAVNATKYALIQMRKQGAGQIINIGSPGFVIGLPFLAPYASSKAAMQGWTRSLQSEWSDSGIYVTEYLPGYIKTDSLADSEFGKMGQDVFDDPGQNALLRWLARPKSAQSVADQLVSLVKRPKRIAYSGFGVRLGVWLSNLSSFRGSTGSKMARTFRKRMGITIFKD